MYDGVVTTVNMSNREGSTTLKRDRSIRAVQVTDLSCGFLGSRICEEHSEVTAVFSQDTSVDVEPDIVDREVHVRIKGIVEESAQ